MFGRGWKQKLFNHRGWLIGSLALSMTALGLGIQPANAEGSRNLYPSGIAGNRGNIEWRTSAYGPGSPSGGNSLKRRTLLKVYAKAGEYILLGSSAIGNGSADILIYDSSQVTGQVGQEIISGTAKFSCQTQRSGSMGKITSRNQELAGPQAISGGGNSSGYVPCYYQVPTGGDGVYNVLFYGAAGGASDASTAPVGDVSLQSANDFNSQQDTNIAAWDVTVRSSTQTSTTDLTGRLFSYYLALFTGNNSRPLYSSVYIVTLDGFKYKTDLRGMDPNGFLVYGNQIGFYDSDGTSPLYHDVVAQPGTTSDVAQLHSLFGNTNFALPQYPIFFNQPDNLALGAANISIAPILPSVSSAQFSGNVSGNTSAYDKGGNFTFSSTAGIYEIVISKDGTNFDPTNPSNRVLRGITSGSATVSWNGKDNSYTPFPVGKNYPVQVKVHAGEYHFPQIDVEASAQGGPSFTLTNATNPLGNTTGFYDDRSYLTVNGGIVNPSNGGNTNAGPVGGILCGTSPPTISYSNDITGFDTTGSQRAFGQTVNNANVPCNGSFGDGKGLDTWLYYPSNAATTNVNIVANAPDLTITKTHTGNFTQGSTGSYTITATNSGGVATDGTVVTVSDTLPTGLTPTSASGTGWTCTIDSANNKVTCTRSDVLNALSSYPAITLNVAVASNAATNITNTATVAGGGETNTANDSASDATTVVAAGNPPHLLLVKRITRINSTDITGFVHAPPTTDDNDPNWPSPTSTSLRGAIDGGKVMPDDEVEYTIYFLSNGGKPATNVTICDLVPTNQTFIFDAFNGLTPTDGGTATADSGIALALSSTSIPTAPTAYLSNIADADRGQFIRPGATLPKACSGSNTNGAVVVNIVTGATSLPNATAPGTPFNSYGFIRFRAKVN